MANPEHVDILKEGVRPWNKWREENPGILPDLKRANLAHQDLSYADFSKANLVEAHLTSSNLMQADFNHANLRKAALSWSNLYEANLCNAILSGAFLMEANFKSANLSRANLTRANLGKAYLRRADLSHANLSGANLENANLVNATLIGANLTGCRIYGISAWDLVLQDAKQADIIITRPPDPVITVDNIEMAQFIHLLIKSEKIRDVIDTITSKVVLILGRFTPKRKIVLDRIREELRRRNYLPILFDFEKPASRDITETISILAHMACFVIADISEAKSIPQELERIIPDLPSVPVQPLLQASVDEYGMFEHFKRYPWVLEVLRYEALDDLLGCLGEKIIVPAENLRQRLIKI
jgi:hypothetical protein